MGACCSKAPVADTPEEIAARRENVLKAAEERQQKSTNRGIHSEKMKQKLKARNSNNDGNNSYDRSASNVEKERSMKIVNDWNS
jgi:hypothetical protein